MTQYNFQLQNSEHFHNNVSNRRAEMAKNHWNRNKSMDLALKENITLTDKHWDVITYLRKHYLHQGLAKNARSLANDLDRHYIFHGGNKYLRQLFPEGPVTQGCRLANLPTPANATDRSFGISY